MATWAIFRAILAINGIFWVMLGAKFLGNFFFFSFFGFVAILNLRLFTVGPRQGYFFRVGWIILVFQVLATLPWHPQCSFLPSPSPIPPW